MTDGSSTGYDKKKGAYILCAECGEKLYLNNGFNRLDGDPRWKKCYRQRRNQKSVIAYNKKSMVH